MTLHLAIDAEYEAWLDAIASTPAERAAQREAEKIALVLGLPSRRPQPQPVETPAPAPVVEAPEQPAKRQPRQYGTAADLAKPIDPRAFNLRSRHRSRSCNHGAGQS